MKYIRIAIEWLYCVLVIRRNDYPVELFSQVMKVQGNLFPNGEVGEDLDGQLVIYTGLKEINKQGNLVDFQA